MTATDSALYIGKVTHRRLRPRRHFLAYRTYALLIDLDELPALNRRLRLFSHNAFNLFSFFDRDYGSGGASSLRAQIEAHGRGIGLDLAGGAIRLLTMPRILGYSFNPLSVYFCHDRRGALLALLYEVTNTFGERHSYFIPVESGEGPIRQSCEKRLYVSPFMPMEMVYDFTVTPPAEKVSIAIVERDREGVVLTATQTQNRAALTDAALLRLFFTHPLLTSKVIVGIHFEALLLWGKGLRLQRRPPKPERPVTLVARRNDEQGTGIWRRRSIH